MNEVTVTCARKRYTLSFSQLPGKTFGPYEFVEAIGQLHVGALISRRAARDLVLQAFSDGSAKTEIDF